MHRATQRQERYHETNTSVVRIHSKCIRRLFVFGGQFAGVCACLMVSCMLFVHPLMLVAPSIGDDDDMLCGVAKANVCHLCLHVYRMCPWCSILHIDCDGGPELQEAQVDADIWGAA